MRKVADGANAILLSDMAHISGLVAAGVVRRVRSHCRFVLSVIHFILGLLIDSVPLFLKQQCDRTLGALALRDV
jgi:hypothetical protein